MVEKLVISWNLSKPIEMGVFIRTTCILGIVINVWVRVVLFKFCDFLQLFVVYILLVWTIHILHYEYFSINEWHSMTRTQDPSDLQQLQTSSCDIVSIETRAGGFPHGIRRVPGDDKSKPCIRSRSRIDPLWDICHALWKLVWELKQDERESRYWYMYVSGFIKWK